jgi:hypothetical protein
MEKALKMHELSKQARENRVFGGLLRDATSMGRKFFFSWKVEQDVSSSADMSPSDNMEYVEPVIKKTDRVNLIGSEISPGLHAPVFDVDFPIRALPSRTPGHYHLYIDKVLTWQDYGKLLKTLSEVGIIEKGYADAAFEKGGTYVRLPKVEYYGK